MTRPRAASDRFVAQLPNRVRSRVTVLISPLLEIRPLAVPVDTRNVAGLIFTSANGVNAAAAQGVKQGLPAWCVGSATTRMAKAAGWTAQMMGATAEELVASLLRLQPLSPLLHLRGEYSCGNIAERLTGSGLSTREQPIYQQRLLPLSGETLLAAEGDRPVIAPLFSPRTARHFAEVWAGSAPLWLVAISEPTAEPLKSLTFELIRVVSQPTPDKMQKAVNKLVKHAMRVEDALGAD